MTDFVWPSDIARDESDELNRVCKYAEELYDTLQASREEVEPIGFLQSSGVSQLSGGHPAKLYPIGATPSPFESSTLVYTNPVSTKVPEAWRTTMKELADDLESEIESRRSGDLDRRIERDLLVVDEARVLLDEQDY